VALVTGGSGRIGRQICRGLVEGGARVAVVGRDAARCEEAVHELDARALALVADVTRPEDLARAVATVTGEWQTLDILVNAAGIARPVSMTLGSDADWDEIIRVNLTGTFLAARAAAPVMIRQQRGKIVNVASIYGVVGLDTSLYGEARTQFGALAYAASKGGVISFTRDLAIELGPHNIQVNAMSPGAVQSRQDPAFVQRYSQRTPLGRMAKGSDLNGAVTFLASAASDYLTGHNLVLDGGFTAW